MNSRYFILSSISIFAILLAGASFLRAAGIVTIEAESGTLGSNFTNGANGAIQFISISTDTVNSGNPGTSNRTATYTVVFPEAGTYNLFARIRVGSGSFNDDSMFYGNGFGTKSATTDNDWMLVNGLASGGFTAASDVVTGNGSAGNLVWKWVNLSQFNPSGSATETPITFTVPAGNLTQAFQIGARENGLDLDKFVFGDVGTSFTVSNLDAGTLPTSIILTNVFPGPDGSTVHRFSPLNNGLNADGANPAAGVVVMNDVLYGTTLNGGSMGAGVAFAMSLDGTNFAALRTFANAPDAGSPAGELALSGDTFFGTTFGGGSSGVGSVFIGQTNGSSAVIRSFPAISPDNATNNGGASPSALLALADTMLYGTTTTGGADANGTVFSLATNGATLAVLHNFALLDSQSGTNADGAIPWGGVILAGDTLYGTTSAGGSGGNGSVFSIRTNGANFTTLYSFSPMDPFTGTNLDGAMPLGGLVLASNTLYGTAFAGGTGGRGTMFSLQTNGAAFTVLHYFATVDMLTGTNTDGASPSTTLFLSSNVLYGTASTGGTGAAGTVYSYNLNQGGFTTIRSFRALGDNGTNADGAFPVAPLLRAGNSLFGTAFSGGAGAAGTVFSIPIPPPPAIFTGSVANINGGFTFHFLGGANTTNVVQSTPSLTPPIIWQDVFTNIADGSGAWQFTDFNDSATRFYRSYAR